MGSGEAAGGETAADARAQGVQPAGPNGFDLGAPVPLADVFRSIPTSVAAAEVRRQQESLERRAADQDLVRELAAGDFGGRRYQRFEEELARYGISVLRGWMHSGFIFKLLRGRGFPLYPNDRELEELFRDTEAREDLASMTVAFALPRFRERALVDGGWRYDGGASLTTYFMGACLYVFPNEFRKRRVDQKKWSRANNREGRHPGARSCEGHRPGGDRDREQPGSTTPRRDRS